MLREIIDSEKLNVDDYTKKLMLKKVKTFAKKHEFDNNRLKEKLSFFINNIVNIINGEPEDPTTPLLTQDNLINSVIYMNKDEYITQSKVLHASLSDALLKQVGNDSIVRVDGGRYND